MPNELTLSDVVTSVLRWLLGTSVGCVLGGAAGLALIEVSAARKVSGPIVGFFRSLPIFALVFFVRRYMGISEIEKVGLIAWATFFPVLLSTGSIQNPELDEVRLRLKVLGVSRAHLFRHFTLPTAALGLLRGVEVSLGIGWLTVVAAELIGTEMTGWSAGGLGYRTAMGFDSGAFWTGMTGLTCFGMLGLLTAIGWRALHRRALVLLGLPNAER